MQTASTRTTTRTRSGKPKTDHTHPEVTDPVQKKVLAYLHKKGTSFADSIADGIPGLPQFDTERFVDEALRALKSAGYVREPKPGQWSVAR